MLVPDYPWKIVQTPDELVVLYENFTQYRQIFTDGRTFPAQLEPTWFGYSIGHWEGDVMVVETAGLNDKAWLDDGGHPRSEQMKTTEKLRRKDFGHMEIEFTFNDPKAYTAPWSVTVPFELMPDTDIIENICENEKDLVHIKVARTFRPAADGRSLQLRVQDAHERRAGQRAGQARQSRRVCPRRC